MKNDVPAKKVKFNKNGYRNAFYEIFMITSYLNNQRQSLFKFNLINSSLYTKLIL